MYKRRLITGKLMWLDISECHADYKVQHTEQLHKVSIHYTSVVAMQLCSYHSCKVLQTTSYLVFVKQDYSLHFVSFYMHIKIINITVSYISANIDTSLVMLCAMAN